MKKLEAGSVIHVTGGSWKAGARGIIGLPIEGTTTGMPKYGGLVHRDLNTPRGPLRFYWVKFEEPQWDADGDGPYIEAEINEQYLEVDA